MNNFDAKKVKNEIVQWIKDLFKEKFSQKNCCIALSGGKDSSVVAALCVEALGKDKVKAIMLPQHEQSDIDCSILCAKHLGIDYKIINIGEAVDSIISEMESNGVIVTEQARVNVPARIRMAALYFLLNVTTAFQVVIVIFQKSGLVMPLMEEMDLFFRTY